MSGRQDLAQLVADLGRSMGLPGLRLDEDGLVALAFDGRLVLHIGHEPATDLAVLYIELPAPCGGREPGTLERALLEANLTAAETGGASFALHPETGRPFLVRRLPAPGLALPEFEAMVRDLLDAAEAWSARLARPADSAEAIPVLPARPFEMRA